VEKFTMDPVEEAPRGRRRSAECGGLFQEPPEPQATTVMAVEIRNASAISLNQSQKVTLSFPSVLVATLHYRTDSLVTLRRSRMVSKNKN